MLTLKDQSISWIP